MNRKEFIRLKAGLLSHGVKITPEAKEQLLNEYPHFFVKGFVHATNMSIYGSNLCVSVADGYSADSEYILCKSGSGHRSDNECNPDSRCVSNSGYNSDIGHKSDNEYNSDSGYEIRYGEKSVPVKFFGALPKTGTVIDGMAQLHAPGCINIWPSSACCYDADELKCKFCSLEKERSRPLPIEELADGIKKLLTLLGDGRYVLNMSGGTYVSPDYMADYYISLVKKLREFTSCPITIELAPPSDTGKLKELKDAGCTAVIMNIEIASKSLREKICPGKSRISYEHYHASMRYAVELFGHGMVSSVLIGGIQPKADILRECEILASEGVFPTIMPFRPFDNCELHGFKACSPDELVEMSEVLGGLLRKYKLAPEKQPGCTECGGCSIENDCYTLDGVF